MLWKILLCLLILIIPLLIWNLIAGFIQRTLQADIDKYKKLLKTIENPKVFQATVINKELINCWTVLTATPSPDGSGFYIKTSDRSVSNGDMLDMAVLPEFENREEELRGTQVITDESGRFLTQADYARMMTKFDGKLEDAEIGNRMFSRLSFYVNAALLVAGLIFSVMILLHKTSAGS